jgi:hypothetical protein
MSDPFLLIAAVSTIGLNELNKHYKSSFNSNFSLYSMVGIIDSYIYIFITKEIETDQIISIVEKTIDKENSYLQFIIELIALIMYVEKKESIPHDLVYFQCKKRQNEIAKTIDLTNNTIFDFVIEEKTHELMNSRKHRKLRKHILKIDSHY